MVRKDIKVQVCIYGFDLLYLNGESLITKSLSDRRDALRTQFDVVPAKFEFASSLDVPNKFDKVNSKQKFNFNFG